MQPLLVCIFIILIIDKKAFYWAVGTLQYAPYYIICWFTESNYFFHH